jgi:hypothetical protein
VTGLSIRPNSVYNIMTDCNFVGGRVLSAASEVRTRKHGDTNGDGSVNVIDIGTVVNAIKELWAQATFEGTNVWSSSLPCEVDDRVNVLDLSVTVDAVKGLSFTCASLCP